MATQTYGYNINTAVTAMPPVSPMNDSDNTML